ncbi:DUF6768 family protein [Brevundimonas fluminis]|jgi:hypothetical protein|uniref:DUF6768 family protein n=1 Tax=Brevundimonas fluminis TaxID=2487274 RepID=UPI000F656E21|nr:DUF6768 family protein [Brevundimonas fluminis]
MTDFDRTLNAALSAEERDLLARIGDEPGVFTQIFGLFRGPTAWVNVLMMVVQTVLFLLGVWAAVGFFQADDALEALRWGLPAATAMLMALIVKSSMWPVAQIGQLRLEIRRLEAMALARRG